MQRNLAFLPVIGYGLLLAATGGSIWYGRNELLDYQQRGDDEVRRRQEESQSAEAEAGARNRLMLAQLNPFMIAGTIAMTGLGAFIMFTGVRRQRKRRRQMIETYYEEN